MRSLLMRMGAMALLLLALLVALGQINGIIAERKRHRDEAVQDIARSSSYAQQLTGPILVVPYQRTVRELKRDPLTPTQVIEERQESGRLYFLPESFQLDGRLRTEQRARGIHQVRLYHADNQLNGYFQLPEQYGITTDVDDYQFGTPFLSFGISDIRGIESMSVRVDEQVLTALPGSGEPLLGGGLHVPLANTDGLETRHVSFAVQLRLQGTSQFHLTPVGRDSQVVLTADWPHPGFTGEYLPTLRRVTASGFSARWQTSFFSTNLEEALLACARGDCKQFSGRHFGVDLLDPVDQYLKSDRAIKYALLFIALTFAGCFLFEVLKQVAVHPVQYGLVGAALALFYLLLLSLSEHIGFAPAYLIASAACVGLIGFYISHAMRSWRRGAAFACGLALLYAVLFGLLSSEDYALLMGSVLLFALLAATMVLTRKVNWFRLGE